jgi:PTH1 family peptidyl-tRNA hydrolase
VALFGRPGKGAPADWLIVGLGNPGKQYAATRHNVGADAVELLAARHDVTLKGGRDHALVAETRFGDDRVVLAFPITYMNESGRAVGSLVRRHRIEDPSRLVVLHDELDLPPGVVRVKAGGGLAGNNGLRSITQHLSTQDYLRIRIGIGKPPHKDLGANHVLHQVPKAERLLLDTATADAADAAELIVADGVDAAMQRYNART